MSKFETSGSGDFSKESGEKKQKREKPFGIRKAELTNTPLTAANDGELFVKKALKLPRQEKPVDIISYILEIDIRRIEKEIDPSHQSVVESSSQEARSKSSERKENR